MEAPNAPAASGMIADIQRFSLHDGPGIRTTVFLKGCNMRCAWCHNPETISPLPQVLVKPERCIGCGRCAEGCFSGARVPCGERMDVEAVMEEIRAERPYYGEEGGMTLSGGEPGCQAPFSLALLQACRGEGIHTAVETNMSLPEDSMRSLWSNADLVLADLKLWDEDLHREWTGIPNGRIRSNIAACAADGVPILLHTPVVCGVNDSVAEIGAIAAFTASLPTLVCYELLPYHPLGLSKGVLEGFTPRAFEAPSRERMEELAQIAAKQGIPVRIAGKTVEAPNR